MLKVNVDIAAFLTLNNYVWKMGPCGLVDEKKFPIRKNGRKKKNRCTLAIDNSKSW